MWDSNIDAMRAVLLLSIVSAHSSVARTEINGAVAIGIWRVWQVWACIGVPGFLILSGYLFKGKQESFTVMLRKKATSVMIPWIVCGTFIFFVSNYPTFGIGKMFQFLVGYYSYLYYIPVLLVCFLLFYFMADKSVFLILCIVVNISSLYVTQCGIYHAMFTNYLNILNWIGYFAVGCLLKKYDVLIKLKYQRMAVRWLVIFFPLGLIFLAAMNGMESYFYWFAFIVGTGSAIGIYCLCGIDVVKKLPYIATVGRWAFTIYLLHMPLAAVVKRMIRWISPNLYIVIPIIVIFAFCVLLQIICKLSEKRILFKHIMKIIGMR